MPEIQANGINIYYEILGAGDPLVLISGMTYDLWLWHKMVPGLAEHFQVITFDNRGVGQTDKPPGPYSAQMLADDVAALLDALNIERTAVMGMSMGGYGAQGLALSRPEMVNKLILASTDFGGPNCLPVTPEAMAVLTDATLDPVERTRWGLLVACAPGFGEANPEFIQEWIDHRLNHPMEPEAYQAQLAIGLALRSASVEESFQSKLKKIQSPTLLLWGEFDKVTPPGNADLLAREIPNSTIEILDNAGHLLEFEVPNEANQAIIEFLKA